MSVAQIDGSTGSLTAGRASREPLPFRSTFKTVLHAAHAGEGETAMREGVPLAFLQ